MSIFEVSALPGGNMEESERNNTSIQGNVERLTQIGTVNGDVFIVSNAAVNDVFTNPPPHVDSSIVTDATEYISVVVKSNRFGRRVKVRVPHDMGVRAFIRLLAQLLNFPWNGTVHQLMISFDFSYAVIFGDKKLSLTETLREAGLSDGDEIQLSITAKWSDDIEAAEHKEAKMGPVMYEMGGRMAQLAKRSSAQHARGSLTRDRIKSLADGFFQFVDEAGRN
jgi:hypothetical protein